MMQKEIDGGKKRLSNLLFAVSLLFLCMSIVFVFKKPSFLDKAEAILLGILGFLIYSSLGSGDYLKEPILALIFFEITIIFLWAIIFFIFVKPQYIERWQAILVSLLGFCIYGVLFSMASTV